MEGIDTFESHTRCQQTCILIRKSLSYVSCLICLVLIAIYGIRGIFRELSLSLIFLFFFIIHLINFFYFDILLVKSKKVILVDEDIENPTLLGFPVRSSGYHMASTTDQGYHGSLDEQDTDGRQVTRPARRENASFVLEGEVDHKPPPSYHEVMMADHGRLDCSGHQCETPPPEFESVKVTPTKNDRM